LRVNAHLLSEDDSAKVEAIETIMRTGGVR
jgi:hypothetical protein